MPTSAYAETILPGEYVRFKVSSTTRINPAKVILAGTANATVSVNLLSTNGSSGVIAWLSKDSPEQSLAFLPPTKDITLFVNEDAKVAVSFVYVVETPEKDTVFTPQVSRVAKNIFDKKPKEEGEHKEGSQPASGSDENKDEAAIAAEKKKRKAEKLKENREAKRQNVEQSASQDKPVPAPTPAVVAPPTPAPAATPADVSSPAPAKEKKDKKEKKEKKKEAADSPLISAVPEATIKTPAKTLFEPQPPATPAPAEATPAADKPKPTTLTFTNEKSFEDAVNSDNLNKLEFAGIVVENAGRGGSRIAGQKGKEVSVQIKSSNTNLVKPRERLTFTLGSGELPANVEKYIYGMRTQGHRKVTIPNFPDGQGGSTSVSLDFKILANKPKKSSASAQDEE